MRRSRAPLFIAVAAAMLGCFTRSAAATERLPLQLEWSAPLACPTGEQVERELAHITRIRAGRTLQLLVVRGVISEQPHGFRLALELSKDGALRQAQFDSPTCAPLREVATLVVALAFGDGVELARETAPAPASDVAVDERAAAATAVAPSLPHTRRDEAPSAQGTRSDSARPRLVPWLAAVTSSGLVGPAALGGEAGLALGGSFWAAFARAGALPPVTAASREGVSARLSAMTAGLGACARLTWDWARIDGCLALDAGIVRARSNGAMRDGAASVPWYGVGPGLGLLLPLPRPFVLRAELAAHVSLTAARYDVQPLGTIYAAPRLTPRGSLGLGVEL